MVDVLHVRAFEDNYIWLLRGPGREVVVVDPGDAEPVLELAAREQWRLAAILCTHHHGDHVAGAAELRAQYRCPVYGPANERIAAVTQPVAEGDRVELPALGITLNVLDIPGHTAGHIAYVGEQLVFCGDTLFSAGCGRLFEGTAAQLYHSLQKLARLPDDTAVYCGHEYTCANLHFALTVEPDNDAARAQLAQAQAVVAQGRPTLPSTMARERAINPFLRVDRPAVWQAAEAHVGQTLSSPAEVFAAVRRWKDGFKR